MVTQAHQAQKGTKGTKGAKGTTSNIVAGVSFGAVCLALIFLVLALMGVFDHHRKDNVNRAPTVTPVSELESPVYVVPLNHPPSSG